MATLVWKGQRAYAVKFLGRVEGKTKFESYPLGKFARKLEGKEAFYDWNKWHSRDKNKKITLHELIDVYLEFSKANKSARTHFGEKNQALAVKKEFIGLMAHEVTVMRVEAYKRSHPAWKPTTWRNRLGFLKHVLAYGKAHGFKVEDPFSTVKIPHPRLDEFLTRAVSLEEIDKLIEVTPMPYKAFCGIMRYTAARPVEVKRLKPQDIDRKNLTVRLFGKKKYRMIQIPKEALPHFDHVGLFTWCDTTLAHVLKKICDKKENELPSITPYMFRHSVATHLGQKGMSLREIQEFLGQSTPAITARYVTVSQGSFAKISGLLCK